MKLKKALIFLSAFIILPLAVFVLGYEKPRILIYNHESKIHENIEVPLDLTVEVNGKIVFKDSLEISSSIAQALIDIETEFSFGHNVIVAYSNKANLYDYWSGYYSWNNKFEISIRRTSYSEVDVTRLEILDYYAF